MARGVWRCAQRWVWVPDQVWNDGQGALERRTGGAGTTERARGDSRSGAGMTEERPRRPRLDLGPKRRWSAGRGPERPANRVGGWLGGWALRTTLGLGSRSSLERRTEADRGGGGMRRRRRADSRSGAGMTEESPRRPRLDLGPKRRWSAGRGPERPANRVGGWLGGWALRTTLGMGSRSSLERRTGGAGTTDRGRWNDGQGALGRRKGRGRDRTATTRAPVHPQVKIP